MTVVQSKKSRQGFTMVEAIMALVVAAMVFEALAVILPQSKKETIQDVQADFQAALTQLERQNYQLDRVQTHEIRLKKTIGEPVTLKIAKHYLVLDGAQHGRVFLLQGIDDLQVKNFGTYQFLTVSSQEHKKATGTLFLPKAKRTITEEG